MQPTQWAHMAFMAKARELGFSSNCLSGLVVFLPLRFRRFSSCVDGLMSHHHQVVRPAFDIFCLLYLKSVVGYPRLAIRLRQVKA